jgi:hypothetical protein
MTDDRSLERAARSFIEVGPTRAPEYAVDAALLRIQTTPQERDWLPWRFPRMTTTARIAALVAVGALTLAGLGLLLGGPGAAPAPTPTPTPSGIPDGFYQAQPQQVADILDQIAADPALTAGERNSLIESVLGIDGHSTLQAAIEVSGDQFTTLLKRDDGPFEPDVPWAIESATGATITFTIPCCGIQEYEVAWADGAFTLRALTPTSAVEAAARRIIFEAGPFVPAPRAASAPSPAAAPSVRPSPSSFVGACLLVTSDEAATIAGDIGLGALPSESGSGDVSRCLYADGGGNVVLRITSTTVGGAAAFAAARDTPGVEVIGDLGDEAVYDPASHTLHVLVGDATVSIVATGSGGSAAGRRDDAIEIGQLVVDRM